MFLQEDRTQHNSWHGVRWSQETIGNTLGQPKIDITRPLVILSRQNKQFYKFETSKDYVWEPIIIIIVKSLIGEASAKAITISPSEISNLSAIQYDHQKCATYVRVF